MQERQGIWPQVLSGAEGMGMGLLVMIMDSYESDHYTIPKQQQAARVSFGSYPWTSFTDIHAMAS